MSSFANKLVLPYNRMLHIYFVLQEVEGYMYIIMIMKAILTVSMITDFIKVWSPCICPCLWVILVYNEAEFIGIIHGFAFLIFQTISYTCLKSTPICLFIIGISSNCFSWAFHHIAIFCCKIYEIEKQVIWPKIHNLLMASANQNKIMWL